MKRAVVTDSTCDIPLDIRNEIDILSVVPLKINFAEESFVDGVDITAANFFDRLQEKGEMPSTSQPAVGEFVSVYESLTAEYDEIFSIHLSGELSGTLRAAHTASQQIEGASIKIFDSQSASLGLGFMVLLVVKLLEQDRDWNEIMKVLEDARDSSILYFTVDDLTYLEKGGRIGKASALLGSILNFQPILTVPGDEGEVIPAGKVRGKKRLQDEIVERVKDRTAKSKKVWLGIVYGAARENAEDLKSALEAELSKQQLEFITIRSIISPVLGCHTGPSVYGAVLLQGEFLPDDIYL